MSIEQALASAGALDAPLMLSQQLVGRLRQLIVTGELAPGAHLVETELASAFDVSRGPVREALRQLLSEGLVGTRRGRTYVIGLTPSDVEELYHLRFLVEGEALRLAIGQEPATFAEIEAALNALHGAHVEHDAASYAVADLDFHTAFYHVARHRRLRDVWLMYRPTFAGILTVTNAEDHDLGPSYDDHVKLLHAVKNGTIDTALEVLRAHLEGSKERFLNAHRRRLEA